jgi:hypothetical protein
MKSFGLSALTLCKEIWRLYRGAGALRPDEYFSYKLCDPAIPFAEKARFLSDFRHWNITYRCSDPRWDALTEDKWASYQFLGSLGISVPRTVAVFDKSARAFPSCHKLSSTDDLRRLLSTPQMLPLFVKANSGLGSFGAMVIAAFRDDMVFLEHSEPLTVERLASEYLGTRTYIFQPVVQNHRKIGEISPHLATVRTINLIDGDVVRTPFILFKIPSQSSIADNYWREGNMLAAIDPASGKIFRVVKGKGRQLEELVDHPETGARLVGMQMPLWRDVRALNEKCARIYAPVRYQSLDIAITDEGPMVIEVNTGGGFDLPQFATGRGFLTDEVRAFFVRYGCKF